MSYLYINLTDKYFVSTFKNVFGIEVKKTKEAKLKILDFVKKVINLEYKKNEELNMYEEFQKYFEYLSNYFIFVIKDKELEIKVIKESFIKEYKNDLILLFNEKEVKELKYNYKHFYFLNYERIKDSFILLGMREQTSNEYKETIKKFKLSKEIKELYIHYIEDYQSEHSYFNYYLKRKIYSIKEINNITLHQSVLKKNKETKSFEIEKKQIKEYFEENKDKYDFSEIRNLIEMEDKYFVEEEHKRIALTLLDYFLKNYQE